MSDVQKDNAVFTSIKENLKREYGIETSIIERRSTGIITGLSYAADVHDPTGEEVLLCKDNPGAYYTVTVYLRDKGKPCFADASEERAVEEFIRQIRALKNTENGIGEFKEHD